MNEYDPKKIEAKWQKIWEKKKIFRAKDASKDPKFYGLIEFPYPSGEGLHVGHIRSNTAMDIITRKRRMEGFNVLYPIGWDAFGLPTENYAIKTGIHPAVVTKKNTDTFRDQLKSIGFGFDWNREINTTDPEYFKWTQWIFLQFLKRGLAYKKKMPVNWCPSCKIVLANEEVVDGNCERCGTPTEKRNKEQWMLAITKYADRLDKDLDTVDYLPQIKLQQRNWIGRSEGAEIEFRIMNYELGIKVFTTRPDTLFGVTHLVLAPEVANAKFKNQNEKLQFKIQNWEEVEKYINESKKKSEIERTAEGKEKTGVELKGVKAINPANGEEVSVWIADYVLAEYGTGAVMAVPAHDERDFEFAKKYNLGIREVIIGGEIDKNAYIGSGKLVNSVKFNGMDSEDAKWDITKTVGGRKVTKFKLRDWIFSRQHYWGEPIPVVFCDDCKDRKYNIVVLHGYGTSGSEAWRPWLKSELEKRGHRVFCPDLPNPNHPKVKEQAKAVLDFLQTPGVCRNRHQVSGEALDTILIGSSLGGAVMMRVLEKTKTKIHKAIFVDSVLKPKFTDKERPEVANADDWKFNFSKIKKAAGEFVVLADESFSTIPKEQAEELVRIFDAKMILASPTKRHFRGDIEPEILKIFDDEGIVALPLKSLPIKLPDVEKYQPTDTGESPLASISSWVNTKCPRCGGKARRETDTMPNWTGSSWYYLRYVDPKNKKEFVGSEKLAYWSGISSELNSKRSTLNASPGPVDWYNGGMEHVTLHVLYSRFWHKFLFDLGYVPTSEPYKKRTTHGLILAEGGVKMSKSKGNVINPESIVERFGADSLRIYEMFMGPFDQAIAWSTDGLVGVRRFLEKVWRIGQKIKNSEVKIEKKDDAKLQATIHKTIKKVGEDIESMRFNTAVSALMICANEMDAELDVPEEVFELYIKIIAPFAPHIAEELWSMFGHKDLVSLAKWPEFDEAKILTEKIKIVIQVNGKVRGELEVSSDISEKEVVSMAKSLPSIVQWISGKEVKKTIYVKGRLINFVV